MCQCVFGMAIVVHYFIGPPLPSDVSIYYGLANNNIPRLLRILRLNDTGKIKKEYIITITVQVGPTYWLLLIHSID